MKKLKLKVLFAILKWFDVPVMYKMKIDFPERTISAIPSEGGTARVDAIISYNEFFRPTYKDSRAPGEEIVRRNFGAALGS